MTTEAPGARETRAYVFTERERRLLKEWLRTGEETDHAAKTFSRMRRMAPGLTRDLKLFLEVRRELARLGRWRINVPRSAYGSLLGVSASTPRRKDVTT